MTNRLQSKLMKSLSASRKSITLKGNRKARKQRVTDSITDLIQHTKPCNQTTIVQPIRYNIVHQLRTTINDSIQHSQTADCCRPPHYRSILQGIGPSINDFTEGQIAASLRLECQIYYLLFSYIPIF